MTIMVELEPWERNVAEHADERLAGPRDPAWWFTGVRPDSDRCPGIDNSGKITSLPLPDLSVCGRDEAIAYFDNTWTLHEILFAGLNTTEAFYRPPDHNLRHPMIFYYGHPAALYVNKLRVAGLLDSPVNAYFEEILEIGVDENSWDDMSKNDMVWPSVAEVHAYRSAVYRAILDRINSIAFAPDLGRAVTMDDPAWALFLAFEHDRIHLETSSVLIREMPLRLVQLPAAWPAAAPMRATTANGKPADGSYPENDMVAIPGGLARLGKPRSIPSFGWDNVYGTRQSEVADFESSRCLVSNGEFHEFVADGGYRRPDLWTDEGERWRRFRNTKWPRWWVPTGPTGLHAFRLRTLFEEIDMPWNWPVAVNVHEAKAFCAWRSEKECRKYRLPTEAEFRLLRALPDEPGVADDPVMQLSGVQMRERAVNLGLAWGSECPVDNSPTTAHGVHDAGGNLWVWSEDTFNPLDGFTVHPYYEDFSVPSFGGKHQLILGGSYISTGELASIWSRHFYRPHFLQQAGIRLISVPDEVVPEAEPGDCQTRAELDRYLLMHFGTVEETFGRADHPLATAHGYPQRLAAAFVREAARAGVEIRRVLDVGCAVGGVSFAVARNAVDVVGVDSNPRFTETAYRLACGEPIAYDLPDAVPADLPGRDVRGHLHARAPFTPGVSVDFVAADTGRLPETLGSFDGVIVSGRLGDLEGCLRQFAESQRFLRPGGLLLVTSPRTARGELARLLASSFDLVEVADESSVMRVHARHYEFTDMDISFWCKR
jgi:5-histidylcysteine sulfoxide synthase